MGRVITRDARSPGDRALSRPTRAVGGLGVVKIRRTNNKLPQAGNHDCAFTGLEAWRTGSHIKPILSQRGAVRTVRERGIGSAPGDMRDNGSHQTGGLLHLAALSPTNPDDGEDVRPRTRDVGLAPDKRECPRQCDAADQKTPGAGCRKADRERLCATAPEAT